MSNILITGASGFIGRHLVKRLVAEGRRVNIVGRQNPFESALVESGKIRFFAIDAIGPNTDWRPALEGCSSLVHLAAQVPVRGLDDAVYESVNAQGTARLVHQAGESGVRRIVFASSIFAITPSTNADVIDDEYSPRPATAYGQSKLAAEKSLSKFATSGRSAISLRFPMVYGEAAGGNWARLKQLAALPVPLPLALAHNRRSMLAVENAVDAILHAEVNATTENSGAYAVSEGAELRLAEIVTTLRKGRGGSSLLIPVPVAILRTLLRSLGQSGMADSLLGSLVVDGSRFSRVFDWHPVIDTVAAISASSVRAKGIENRRGQGIGKRVFDVVLAASGLAVLSPFILLLAFLVRVTSSGPALFVQDRIGQNEKPFACYKFRTMATDAPIAGSHQVGESWITPIGHKLRRFKLDEIPQLINVLRGDMSLVGPRPCLPVQDDVINARRRKGVFAVRPGITGLAQLQGIDMSMPDRLAEVDQTYIETRSLTGDLRLLLRTLTSAGRGDAANSRA